MGRRLAAAFAVLLLGSLTACRAPEPARGPIVLVTLGGARADVVGPASREPEWTPHWNELTRTADGTGTAVVASSSPSVSVASLMCGVAPWQHQLLAVGPTRPRLPQGPAFSVPPRRRPLPTLAELLRAAGYRTTAYVPAPWKAAGPGLVAGFESVLESPADGAATGRRTTAALAGIGEEEFVWIHLPDAELTYRRRGRSRSDRHARTRIKTRDILAWADPGEDLPAARRELLRKVYGDGIARADRKLGWIVAGLRKSPAWERALVVVTATHGTELGEHGQILAGFNLGRESIEVPLLLKLPAGRREAGPREAGPRELGSGVLAPAGGPVEQTRLFATVLEAAGVAPSPGGGRGGKTLAPVHAPSLWQRSREPILSELYAVDGANVFSLLDTERPGGPIQLVQTARFYPPEPRYYQALWILAGGRKGMGPGAARRLLLRLDTAFQSALPLTGGERPEGRKPAPASELALERWLDEGVEPFSDPALARELAAKLRQRFLRFVERERPPREEWNGEIHAARKPASAAAEG